MLILPSSISQFYFKKEIHSLYQVGGGDCKMPVILHRPHSYESQEESAVGSTEIGGLLEKES